MALTDARNSQDRLLTNDINNEIDPKSDLPGATITSIFLNRENGIWVLYGSIQLGTVLPTHFHTGTVHFFTTKSRWRYDEHPEDVQRAGSYLYEPGGSIHTFMIPADATNPPKASWWSTAPTCTSSMANITA